MNTHVTIKVIDVNSERAKLGIKAGFEKIAEIENLMNPYNEKTAISLLNKNGVLKNPNSDIIYVMKKAKHYYELSGGLFDVTILPLLELAKEIRDGHVPTTEVVEESLNLVNFKNVVINRDKIYFKKKGMR
ncbi:hypothetical protein DRN86_02940, partial [Candidatus Geothermarchaeota archaeon]